jgi:hypothetical protein
MLGFMDRFLATLLRFIQILLTLLYVKLISFIIWPIRILIEGLILLGDFLMMSFAHSWVFFCFWGHVLLDFIWGIPLVLLFCCFGLAGPVGSCPFVFFFFLVIYLPYLKKKNFGSDFGCGLYPKLGWSMVFRRKTWYWPSAWT